MNKKNNIYMILKQPLFVMLFAIICTAAWGIGFPLIKLGYQFFGIETNNIGSKLLFAGIRFFCSGILLMCFNRQKILFDKKFAFELISVSTVQIVLQYSFQYIGLGFCLGSISSVIGQSNVFLLVLFSPLFFKNDNITLQKIIGSLIGFLGIITINIEKLVIGKGLSFWGEGMIFLGAIAATFGFIISKKIMTDKSALAITGLEQIIGGIALIFIGLAFEGKFKQVNFKSIAIMLCLIITALISNLLWMTLIKYCNLSNISVYKFAVPIFSMFFSALILEENIFIIQNGIALLLVCSGIVLVNIKIKRNI